MNQTQNKNRKPHPEITLIGAAIVDVLAGPVSEKVFQTGSEPVDFMKFSFGGDALNEAVCLSRLGNQVELISQVGRDQTGINVLNFLKQNEVDISKISVEDGLQTGMNIVMVGEDAQRYFLTNPRSSLRTLSKEVILPQLDTAADIIGFASLFVSYRLDIAAMEEVFAEVKKKPGRILTVDMTSAKKGEKLKDLLPLFAYIDVLFANDNEACLLTGEEDPVRNAALFTGAGLPCAVIKCGGKGCVMGTREGTFVLPAFPHVTCVDTTGAGDCFAAGFLWGLSMKLSLRQCGCLGNASASCCVEQYGATDGIISSEEIWRRYEILSGNCGSAPFKA
ncbi:MAG: carbohydrate kinase family protein [Blautia sp.]|nr:carbohydrate kinase family protein [Blautia sp.]